MLRSHAVLTRLTLGLVFVLTACLPGSGRPGAAAIVNGDAISLDEVRAAYVTATADPNLAQQLEADVDGQLQAQVQASLLTQLIRSRVLAQGAEDLGIAATEAEVDARREEFVEQFGGEDAFAEVLAQNNLTEEDARAQLRDLVNQEKLQEHFAADVEVTDEDVEQFYADVRRQRYVTVSVRHILVETEEQAEEVIARLDAGEEFADVAREVSIDPSAEQNGGDLGPLTGGQTVPEFEEAAFEAEIGEIVGPVATQFGFHVLEVYERDEQPLTEVRDELRMELAEQQSSDVFADWLSERLAGAEITVNPRFGEWDPDAGGGGEVVVVDPLGDAPQPTQEEQ